MRHPLLIVLTSLLLLASLLAAAPAPAAGGARHPRARTAAPSRARHHRRAACHGRRTGHGQAASCAPRAHPHARVAPPSSATPATAAQSASAAVAQVLATPCQNTEVTPDVENIPLVEASVLCLVNHERASQGEPPLRLDADLQRAADEHAQELITADYFAHVSPAGVTPVARVRATGYVPGPSFGYVIGENLAWGTLGLSTPQEIVSAWIASPGHLANILESQYTQTGISVVPSVPASLSGGQPGATYAQEFGVVLG